MGKQICAVHGTQAQSLDNKIKLPKLDWMAQRDIFFVSQYCPYVNRLPPPTIMTSDTSKDTAKNLRIYSIYLKHFQYI